MNHGRLPRGINSPLDIAGCCGWWDATLSPVYQTNDTSTPYTTDAQTIGRIEDLSPRQNHLVQGTAGARPIGKENQFNGLRCIRFDGTDDNLAVASALGVGSPGWTIFVVARTQNTSQAGHLCSVGRDEGAGSGSLAQGLSGASPTTVGAQMLHLRNGNTWSGFGSSYADTTTQRLFHVIQEPTRVEYCFAEGAQTAVRTSAAYGTAPNARTSMGSQYNSSDVAFRFWNGDIAAMVVYGRPLATNEHKLVSRYLGQRYGITVS